MTTDPLLFDDPCVLFALRHESAPFVRLFPVQQRFPGAPCRARFCGRRRSGRRRTCGADRS